MAFYAVAKLPSFLEFLVSSTFAHFSRSSIRREGFQSLHVAMRGKKARQLSRIVETRWLSLGDALALIVEQWEVLEAYFQAEATGGGSDVYSSRQLRDLYTSKNKVVIVFVSERIGLLNQLNQAFQGEQPNQSVLLDHLLAFYYSVLDQVITAAGVRLIKASPDPLSFDLSPFHKDPSMIHFG